MIVVDTSGLMAIILGETEADACIEILVSEAEVLISAGTMGEAMIVASRRNVAAEMTSLIDDLGFDVVTVTPASARRIASCLAVAGVLRYQIVCSFEMKAMAGEEQQDLGAGRRLRTDADQQILKSVSAEIAGAAEMLGDLISLSGQDLAKRFAVPAGDWKGRNGFVIGADPDQVGDSLIVHADASDMQLQSMPQRHRASEERLQNA
jgi:predicted nucleic acid-binding protein